MAEKERAKVGFARRLLADFLAGAGGATTLSQAESLGDTSLTGTSPEQLSDEMGRRQKAGEVEETKPNRVRVTDETFKTFPFLKELGITDKNELTVAQVLELRKLSRDGKSPDPSQVFRYAVSKTTGDDAPIFKEENPELYESLRAAAERLAPQVLGVAKKKTSEKVSAVSAPDKTMVLVEDPKTKRRARIPASESEKARKRGLRIVE